jgi:hypothetical protein
MRIPLAIGLLLALVGSGVAQKNQTPSRKSINVFTTSGTLILFGVTTTDITLASDGKNTPKGEQKGVPTGKLPVGEQKIFAAGKYTACTLHNDVGIFAVSSGRIVATDSLVLTEIVRQWTVNHPDATPRNAFDALKKSIQEALRDYYVHHELRSLREIHVLLNCIGYEFGSPELFSIDILEGPQNKNLEPSGQPKETPLYPGYFVALGLNRVSNNLISGSGAILSGYRTADTVQKYRRLKESKRLSAITTTDLLHLSRICLNVTESRDGLKFDTCASEVGAPNEYAVISREKGFRIQRDPMGGR